MAAPTLYHFLLLIIPFLCIPLLVQGSRVQIAPNNQYHRVNLKDSSKRMLIGSVAPICTYNECRGCKYQCRAEQVPVQGNDPINSAYYYKCVCHR